MKKDISFHSISDVLTEWTIVSSIDYNAHIALLTWSEDSRIVTAKIDHDFGEDNRAFNLSTNCPDT